MVGRRKSDQEVFDTYVNKLDGDNACWEWTGHVRTDGYGLVRRNHKNHVAHRWVYETIKAKVPADLQLDHLCRNRKCCNPSHLDPVTHRENQLRGETFGAFNAAKTHCPRGHELVGDNLVTSALKRGQRTCAKCASICAMNSAKRRLARDPEAVKAKRRAEYLRHKARMEGECSSI